MSAPRYRLVLIDNHPLFIEALTQRIGRTTDLEIVSSAFDSESGLQRSLEHRPDLVVINIDIPGRGACNVADDLATRLPATRVIFWGDSFSDVLLDEALRLRVAGCLLTSESAERVLEAFRAVCQGETVFSPEIDERLEYSAEAGRLVAKFHGHLAMLTSRQLTVLRHLARGESVKDVAKRMAISERAVESHKYRIMRLLGIHDRVELARYVIQEGLAVP